MPRHRPSQRGVTSHRTGRRVVGVGIGVALAALLAMAGCTETGGGSTSATTTGGTALPTGDTKGGTLTTLSLGPVQTWDPQRMSSRADIAFATRVFTRTLTSYAPPSRPNGSADLVGDLATDTGTASEDQKTWTFTLRDGLSWQDGTGVTCADVKYGISRSFASQISGGSLYALAMLDLPKSTTGAPSYLGPYDTSATNTAAAAAYDKAVQCDGQRITFHLAAPQADFGEVVSLPAFAPYPKSKDRRGDGTFDVWSTGPYQLKGTWQRSRGGVFVRNPHWKAATDPIRLGLPDSIQYTEGVEAQTVAQRVMASGTQDAGAVTLDSLPPALQQQVTASAELQTRAINPATFVVDYLAPNVKSAVFAKPAARKALAVATNRDGYLTALGRETAASPTFSLIPAPLPAYRAADLLGSGLTGDPARAKTLLTEAGLHLPVSITVAYRSTPTADKAMAALVAGWTEAGFAPTLTPIKDDYYPTISGAERPDADVYWASWAPDWASASTILPPLFDSRLNLSGESTGRDYGSYASDKANAKMTALQGIANADQREQGWADLDADLVKDGAYVALAQRKAMYLAGTRVINLSANPTTGGFLDLARIGVR